MTFGLAAANATVQARKTATTKLKEAMTVLQSTPD